MDRAHHHDRAEAKALLEPFEALAHDAEFWSHSLDGLAVLGGPGVFRIMRLPQAVAELVVVADSFHTKPLRRFLQFGDRYQVLGLSLDKIRLFEGSRYALGVGGASHQMHHGHGAKSDEADIDADRFFRAVDRAVLTHYSKPSGLPLILAALPEHHHRFHQVSQNPLLVAESVGSNPNALTLDELRAHAWAVAEPRYQARLGELQQEFERARAKSAGSDDLAQVAAAATAGRVQTLLIEAERWLAGRLDAATGAVALDDAPDAHEEDLLDDLGDLVAQKGGAGLAAIYRY